MLAPAALKRTAFGLLRRHDDTRSLVDQLYRLISSPELRGELARSAPRCVMAEGSWAQIAGIVDDTYRDLLGGPGSVTDSP